MIAESTVKWTSLPVDKSKMPHNWIQFQGKLLLLKDTRSGHWKNQLVSPNHYRYLLPKKHKKPRDRALSLKVIQIMRNATSEDPLIVDVYAANAARNEYYGRWVMASIKKHTCDAYALNLYRLNGQPEETPLQPPTAPHRSLNERRHEDVLTAAFPPSAWVVQHEPEALIMDTKQPTVIDGVAQPRAGDVGDSYTCDFVVSQILGGCSRLCVESKPTRERATVSSAFAKCRALRDRTLTRVVILCGSDGSEDELYDFGPPGTTQEPGWLELPLEAAFRQILGLPSE